MEPEQPPGSEATGKGKGKGAHKGAPPPVKAGAGPPAPKSKAKGGYLPNVSKVAKPLLYYGLQCIAAQEADGSFQAEAVARELEKIHACSGLPGNAEADFAARLQALGPTGPTAFVLRLLARARAAFSSGDWSGVEVQTVGSGRGDSDKVHEGAPVSEDERAARFQGLVAQLAVQYRPACGDAWLQSAEDWLSSQAPEPSVLDALVDEWFDTFPKRSKGRALLPEEQKEREEEQRRRNEAARQEELRREAHWRGLLGRPVTEVPWSTVRTMLWCSGGMGGAILVQIGDSEAVVVKPQGMMAVGEALAVEIARLVGVRVAISRVLSLAQEEFFTMAAALNAAPLMVEEHRGKVELIVSGAREFVAVVEFIPGCVLQGLGGQRAITSDETGNVLKAMGSLIALDCLLNNLDRVPAIWQNDGNLSNIMVTGAGEVIGIDQQLNPIGDAAGRERYFASLREFCEDVRLCRLEAPSVQRIKTAVGENCGVDLTGEQCQRILEGVRATFMHVAEEKVALLEKIPDLDAAMTKTFGCAWADVGLSRLDFMLEFLRESMAVVADAMD